MNWFRAVLACGLFCAASPPALTAEAETSGPPSDTLKPGEARTLPNGWVQLNDRRMEDGGRYTGTLKKMEDGYLVPQGFGSYTSPDGRRYVGDWDAGKQHGQGTYSRSDGRKYVGEWKHGKQEGTGTMTRPDGTTYEGEWKEGKEHGKGKWTKNNGSRLDGEWQEGEPWNVAGIQVLPEGTFEGIWNRETPSESRGKITYRDGRVFQGPWSIAPGKSPIPTGTGTLTWPDGRLYAGEFHNGKPGGLGRLTSRDGQVQEGVWKEGRLVEAIPWVKGSPEEPGNVDQPKTAGLSQAAAIPLGDGKPVGPMPRPRGGEEEPGPGKPADKPADVKRPEPGRDTPAVGRPNGFGFVTVTSDLEDLEVYSNGEFVGNPPAKLRLKEGVHTIQVRKSGFKEYRREIRIWDGYDLTLRPTLQPE